MKYYFEVDGKKNYFSYSVSGLWSALLFAREKGIPLSDLTKTEQKKRANKTNLPERSPEKEQII